MMYAIDAALRVHHAIKVWEETEAEACERLARQLQKLSIRETKKEGEGTSSGREDTAEVAQDGRRAQETERNIEDIEEGMRTISIRGNRGRDAEASKDTTNKQEERRKRMTKEDRRSKSSKEGDDTLQQIVWEEVAREHGMGGPCTECGITTSNWCDGGSRRGNDCIVGGCTALRTNCDKIHDKCHVCRGTALCSPPEWSGISEPERERRNRQNVEDNGRKSTRGKEG